MKSAFVLRRVIILAALLILAFSTACQKRFDVKKSESDSITSVPGDDSAMNKIIENARNTVEEFFAAEKKAEADDSGFQVKYPFDTDAGSPESIEHIWLSDLTQKDGKHFGIIANDPFYLADVKYGDEVEYDPKKISDWMYFHGDKIVGGESIKYLIENIPVKDRTAEEEAILELFD